MGTRRVALGLSDFSDIIFLEATSLEDDEEDGAVDPSLLGLFCSSPPHPPTNEAK